ncbi:hypothetical protein [Nitratireductor alexandrii]|uniref:hypothetical protein n=1 Tax=Nitratireductor alexandrii TaxID=2448161 RepID=UPI000FD81597|nr:hypothetical protein [Nitratireductor alexandrii]
MMRGKLRSLRGRIGWYFGRDRLISAAGIALIASLIGADLIVASGGDWRGWLRTLWYGERASASGQPDIVNYVEFTTVTAETLEFTTGVRFASSSDRRIVRQWCYVREANALPGAATHMLELAARDETGTHSPNLFTTFNLGPFGLTEAEALDLTRRHCRFRD